MGESVWVLGASMTKIGRYPDKDVIDLARGGDVERARRRAASPSTTWRCSRPGACSTMGGIGQQVAEADRPDRHPDLQRASTRAPPAPPRCAPSYLSIKAGEADIGLAIGAEQMGKMGLLGRQRGARRREQVRARRAATAACMPVDGWLGSGTMPGGLRPGRHGVRLRARRRRLRAVRQGRREEPRALGAEPARAVPEGVHARGDHGRAR